MTEDPEFPAVIGVGASAGGVEALTDLVAALPADLAAPVLVVLHLAPSGSSLLANILDRRTPLHVVTAIDGDRLEAGYVYVAPPDRHLRVAAGVVELDREPRVNGHRPAVDPMLRSIAAAYGARGVGVILSGSRDDGTVGLGAIKAAGGCAFVQDPDEALYDSMPASAMRYVDIDASLPLTALAAQLVRIASEGAPPGEARPAGEPNREPTRLTCPDCGGVIFHERAGGLERYACSVGHEYGPDSFDAEQRRHLESALWAAVRSLEDRTVLLGHLAARARAAGNDHTAERHELERADALRQADSIRAVIVPPRRLDETA